jgi:CRP-like cAMP-binding protein
LESITTDSNEAAGAWVLKVLQILQPEAVKADLLSSMQLFGGLRWPELEVAGAQFDEVAVSRGARLTVQGRADARLCVLISGEALVSADARPLRVIGHGDTVGLTSMLYRLKSPETTVALSPIRALSAGPEQFRELIRQATIRRRLTALAADQLRRGRPFRGR